MKRLSLLALIAAASTAFATPSGTTVILNGTAIDPGTGKIMPNAAITIEGDHIAAIRENSTDIPKKGDVVINARGKFILPGYIDTHVHFFQSGGLFTRPDAVDLTSVRPYKDEVAMIKRNLPDAFARYLRSGITSVLDIGGPLWNFEMRKIANSTAKAPRVAAAGSRRKSPTTSRFGTSFRQHRRRNVSRRSPAQADRRRPPLANPMWSGPQSSVRLFTP